MKLTCLQENLHQGLEIAGRATNPRSTLPILSNILLSIDNGRLKLVASDLEMTISSWIGAKVEESGAITIPARLITEFINQLPNDTVTLQLFEKSMQLGVKLLRYEAKISGRDPKDFPPIPDVGQAVQTSIQTDALKRGIQLVAFAASTTEDRPVLTGVSCKFEDDTLTLAAADGFRLAICKLHLSEAVNQKVDAIIPARTMREVIRLLGEPEDIVEISVDTEKHLVLFRVKNVELVSQLIQGTFPDYVQLIPESFTSRAVVDRGEFLRAARTAYLFARDGKGMVRVVASPRSELNPGKIIISGSADEVGDDVVEIDAAVEGDEFKIAFDGRYLVQVLDNLQEQQVSLEVNSSTSPACVRPVGADDYTYMMMPMLVQW